MSLVKDDDLGRAITGQPAATDEEKAARVTYRQRLVQFFESGDFYRVYPFPETAPQTITPKSIGTMSGSYTKTYDAIEVPTNLRIELQCSTCGDTTRTFAVVTGPQEDRSGSVDVRFDETRMVQFRCTHCGKQDAAFLVHVRRVDATKILTMEKAGVWPSVRPAPKPDLATGLGAAAELFCKGLTVQKFGFGIGALAYYRRVTEDIIERLLAQLREFAEEANETALVQAIDATAAETQASKKIAIVKDLVPNILRRGGLNPLGTLYASLSDGMHGRTDAECLARAEELRVTLEYLVTRLQSLVTTPKQYEEAMKKLQSPAPASAPPAPSGREAPGGSASKGAKPPKA